MITFKVKPIAGKGSVTLSEWENNHGDKWWVIKMKGYSDAKREVNTLFDYTSEALAREEFEKYTKGSN